MIAIDDLTLSRSPKRILRLFIFAEAAGLACASNTWCPDVWSRRDVRRYGRENHPRA